MNFFSESRTGGSLRQVRNPGRWDGWFLSGQLSPGLSAWQSQCSEFTGSARLSQMPWTQGRPSAHSQHTDLINQKNRTKNHSDLKQITALGL